MQAKGAVVPFEDEAFSYLAVSRMPVASAGARIIGPIRLNKVAVTLSVCADGALHNLAIASRDKPSYKQARKLVWGDSYSAHNSGKT
jgi:ribosomal protein RSM22 (predicted rRNA methylase)